MILIVAILFQIMDSRLIVTHVFPIAVDSENIYAT